MRKIPSGVYGLNALMDGGVNENTVTVVIGSSGAGKTTLAAQFLRRGLEAGDDGVFITLDETPVQIIHEARLMGWDSVESYIDEGSLVFVDAGGKQFSKFIRKELSEFVNEWAGHNARIVIDPLTPVLWSVSEKYEQRELVSFLLRQTRRIGTVLCTLEEHGVAGDLSTQDVIIPMYLADNVIHLRYASHESPETREMKIIKCRSSRHSRYWHSYGIMKGAGLYVRAAETDAKEARRADDLEARLEARLESLPPDVRSAFTGTILDHLRRAVRTLAEQEFTDIGPEEILDLMMDEYQHERGDSSGEEPGRGSEVGGG